MINTMREAVGLARQGSKEGQTYLYEQTYRKAYYVALKYMQNEDNALDVVQDAYIKAFSRLEQLDDDDKFDKWINSIVASTALDALKKKKPQLFTDMSNDDEEFDVSEKFEANYTEQPEVVIDQNETARLVQEIISELSDEQRACVTMYYMQEMSVKEISGILNVSDNTVKSRLNYARKNIEAKVKELEKKGTKLYALAPIPFFVFLLRTEADACEATAAAGLFTANAGVGAAGSASSAAGSATGGASSVGAAAGTLSLGAKIAIAFVAIVIAIGGAFGIYSLNNRENIFVGTWIESEDYEDISDPAIKKFIGRWCNSKTNYTMIHATPYNLRISSDPEHTKPVKYTWVFDDKNPNLLYYWEAVDDEKSSALLEVWEYENDTLKELYSVYIIGDSRNISKGNTSLIRQPESLLLNEDGTGIYHGHTSAPDKHSSIYDDIDITWGIDKSNTAGQAIYVFGMGDDGSTVGLCYIPDKKILTRIVRNNDVTDKYNPHRVVLDFKKEEK